MFLHKVKNTIYMYLMLDIMAGMGNASVRCIFDATFIGIYNIIFKYKKLIVS